MNNPMSDNQLTMGGMAMSAGSGRNVFKGQHCFEALPSSSQVASSHGTNAYSNVQSSNNMPQS